MATGESPLLLWQSCDAWNYICGSAVAGPAAEVLAKVKLRKATH